MHLLFSIPCVATIILGYSGNATEVLASEKWDQRFELSSLKLDCAAALKMLKEVNLHRVEERNK